MMVGRKRRQTRRNVLAHLLCLGSGQMSHLTETIRHKITHTYRNTPSNLKYDFNRVAAWTMMMRADDSLIDAAFASSSMLYYA